MLKKIVYTIIIVNIIFVSFYNNTLADDEDEIISDDDYVEVMSQNVNEPNLNSRIAVAYDRTTRSGNMGKK